MARSKRFGTYLDAAIARKEELELKLKLAEEKRKIAEAKLKREREARLREQEAYRKETVITERAISRDLAEVEKVLISTGAVKPLKNPRLPTMSKNKKIEKDIKNGSSNTNSDNSETNVPHKEISDEELEIIFGPGEED